MSHSSTTHIEKYCRAKHVFTYVAFKYLKEMGIGQKDHSKKRKERMEKLHTMLDEEGLMEEQGIVCKSLGIRMLYASLSRLSLIQGKNTLI
jgi:hypothetical protein